MTNVEVCMSYIEYYDENIHIIAGVDNDDGVITFSVDEIYIYSDTFDDFVRVYQEALKESESKKDHILQLLSDQYIKEHIENYHEGQGPASLKCSFDIYIHG